MKIFWSVFAAILCAAVVIVGGIWVFAAKSQRTARLEKWERIVALVRADASHRAQEVDDARLAVERDPVHSDIFAVRILEQNYRERQSDLIDAIQAKPEALDEQEQAEVRTMEADLAEYLRRTEPKKSEGQNSLASGT